MGMTTGKAIHAAVVAASATMAFAAFGEVIYENDFSTRTSAAAIRSAEWKQVDYAIDYLANTNGAKPWASYNGSTAGQRCQDGWIKSQEARNQGNARVYADNGNNMATLGDAAADNSIATSRKVCIVKQRLGATFTNGTVTVQFDFLPPASWASCDGVLRRAVFSVGDEGFFSPDVSNDKVYRHTVGSVGVVLTNFSASSSANLRYVYWNADVDSANTAPSSQEVTRSAWHRVIMTIDLNARAWGFSMYEMGNHPSFDAVTPATPVHSENGLPFADTTVTSVSSICLNGYGVVWSSSSYPSSNAPTPTHAAAFDNIRVFHNGQECYANDFAASRRRRLDGSTTWTYTPDCLVTNRVEDEVYVVEQNLVPDRENNGTTVQPEGIDRWRRVNKDGTGNAAVKSDSNGTYLRFDLSRDGNKKNFYAFLAQPLESTITNGTLKFSVDTRLPTASYWKYQSGFASLLWVTLGSKSYYAGDPDNFSKWRWAAVGIRAYTNDVNTVTYVPRSGDSVNSQPDNGSISIGTWYRIVIAADIDNGNYVYKVYEQGTAYPDSATADGTLIYTSPAIVKKDTINTISCFSLAAYYCPVYFDNIKIWHTPTGAATETLLYENYFTSRTIYAQDVRVAPLVGTLDLNPEGADGWTRIDINETPAFVTDDANPSLVFGRADNGTTTSYAVHDLGQTLHGGMVTAQADIRPPAGWRSGTSSAGAAYVRLGGDAHLMGNIRDDDAYYLENIAAGFGFKQIGSGMSGNIYTNSTIVAYRGDCAGGGEMEAAASGHDVDPTHWYRFVANADMAKSQYDLAVFDMGATQPTLDTATLGSPVATFSALPFRRTARDLGGISCVSVSGCKCLNSAFDDALSVRIDNIRVSHQDAAFVITVR